jgi:hypothetical protein
MASRSLAGDSVKFARLVRPDVSPGDQVEQLRWFAHGLPPGRWGNVVADGVGRLRVKGLDGFLVLSSVLSFQDTVRNFRGGTCRLTYLCEPEELLTREDDEPDAPGQGRSARGPFSWKDAIRDDGDDGDGDGDDDDGDDDDGDDQFSDLLHSQQELKSGMIIGDPAPAFAGRWTRAALRIWLLACGLDPGEAEGIMASTGGWDGLVMSEVHHLAGKALKALFPERLPNGAPQELAGKIKELKAINGPVKMPFLSYRFREGHVGVEACDNGDPMTVLAGLGVLVLAEKPVDDRLWELDPRFR